MFKDVVLRLIEPVPSVPTFSPYSGLSMFCEGYCEDNSYFLHSQHKLDCLLSMSGG